MGEINEFSAVLTAKVSGGEAVRLSAKLDPKAKRERPALEKGAAPENPGATEAAQRCKKDSWWRLAGKRWRPKRQISLWNRAERWNGWLRA